MLYIAYGLLIFIFAYTIFFFFEISELVQDLIYDYFSPKFFFLLELCSFFFILIYFFFFPQMDLISSLLFYFMLPTVFLDDFEEEILEVYTDTIF